MALSLLFSTAGLAVTKHFCEEVLIHVAVGQEASSCCAGNEVSSDCEECENETDHLVVEDEYQLDQQEIKISPALQATLVSFIKFLALSSLPEEHHNSLHSTLDYPPFTDPDIHIRVQSFLL